MARVSLDDASGSSSSKSSSSRSGASSARRGGGSSAPEGKGLGSLDQKQKIKAGASVAVILLAGVFIAWQMGLLNFGSAAPRDPNTDVTAEEVKAYNEQVKREEEALKRTGSSGEVPVPLGAN